jgi:hypothetical protein
VGTTAGAVDKSADAKQLDEGMAAMRSLLQRTGVAIGAAATAVIGGLGYQRLHDVFPVPRTVEPWLTWVLIGSLIAAVVGSAWLAARFLRAQRRILIKSDLEDSTAKPRRWWFDRRATKEGETVEEVLREHAAEEGAATMHAVERRALRLHRISRRTLDPEQLPSRETVAKEAERLDEAVSIALHRASAALLEHRSRNAFGGRTAVPLALAVAGIVGLFALADYYKGERDLIDLRKKCAEAQDAGVVNACEPFEEPDLTAQRIARNIEAAVAARRGATQTPDPTPEQKALIVRVAACAKEINANAATKGLEADVKSAAIALCAQSG